jgi:hypothetical protein
MVQEGEADREYIVVVVVVVVVQVEGFGLIGRRVERH